MKVKLNNVRLAFPNLFKPEQINGEGDPKYGATFILPKGHPALVEINKAMEQVAKDKWGDKTQLNPDDGVMYAGCYVNAVLDIWAMDNKFGKRICATLSGAQFFKDGDAFTGGAPATEADFDDYSVTPEDGFSID